MAPYVLKLTATELQLLTALASDQLFRREFIDPKMPGHRPDPDQLRIGKKLIERLQGMSDRAKRLGMRRVQRATA